MEIRTLGKVLELFHSYFGSAPLPVYWSVLLLLCVIRAQRKTPPTNTRKNDFIRRNPKYGYKNTLKGPISSWRSNEYPSLSFQIYLDNAGAALPMKSQLEKECEEGVRECFGNPHSSGPSAGRTKVLVDESRHR